MNLNTMELQQKYYFMQAPPTFLENKSCIAYMVFRSSTDYEKFITQYQEFISHLPEHLNIEKLHCSSFLTCELRIEGQGDLPYFRDKIIEAYNLTFYSLTHSGESDEIFDHFYGHTDFIIRAIEFKKKNYIAPN